MIFNIKIGIWSYHVPFLGFSVKCVASCHVEHICLLSTHHFPAGSAMLIGCVQHHWGGNGRQKATVYRGHCYTASIAMLHLRYQVGVLFWYCLSKKSECKLYLLMYRWNYYYFLSMHLTIESF